MSVITKMSAHIGRQSPIVSVFTLIVRREESTFLFIVIWLQPCDRHAMLNDRSVLAVGTVEIPSTWLIVPCEIGGQNHSGSQR